MRSFKNIFFLINLAMSWLAYTTAQAAEFELSPPQVKLWLNAAVPIGKTEARMPPKWHFHVFMPNLVQPAGRAPWFYTGPSWQMNNQFNIELVGGMGTGIGDDARGVAPIAGAWFTWTPPKGWVFWSALEWWGMADSQTLFNIVVASKRVRESPVSLGLEHWAIVPLASPGSTTFLGGPNIHLKLGDHFAVRATLMFSGSPNSDTWGIGPNVFLFCNL